METTFELSKVNREYELSFLGHKRRLLLSSVEKFDLFCAEFMDECTFAEIAEYDDFLRCRNKAYDYLALRDHFALELTNKLRAKSYSQENVQKTLECLNCEGLLDDELLAYKYAERRLKSYGFNKVRYELACKGVPFELAKLAVEACGVDESEVCFELLCDKVGGERVFSGDKISRDEFKKREAKLVNRLKNKGFSVGSIIKAVDRFKLEILS